MAQIEKKDSWESLVLKVQGVRAHKNLQQAIFRKTDVYDLKKNKR